MSRKNYYNKKKIVNVDNNEENFNKKIILHDDEHDDKNINLDGVN